MDKKLPETVEELCQELQEKRLETLKDNLGPWPKNNPTASDISDCPRETVYGMTHWKERPGFDPEVRARLDRGSAIEKLVKAELSTLGYTVKEDRFPFEIRDKKGRLICRGIVDGFISRESRKKDFPFEVKSLNPNVYNQINVQEDFDRYIFFRKYPRQLQTYMFANNYDQGFWILDDCMGHQKFIPCRLDYDRMEAILQHLEAAVDHREKRTLPDYHKDPAVCFKCWAFKRICTPPFFRDEGMKVFDDPELEAKLDDLDACKVPAAEHARLKKELLPLFMNKKDYVIGKWLVLGEEKKRNMKAQPAKEAEETKYWQTKFERIEKQSDGTEQDTN